MLIDQSLLIFLFITPGLFISSLLGTKKEYLLTLSFSIFFWSFSSVFIQMNYLINNLYGNLIVYTFLIFWLIKYKNFKNLLINFSLILLFESINNIFGVLHLVSTTQITLNSSLSNLAYGYTNLGVSSIQNGLLKFLNNDYILLTIQQCLSVSLLLYNLKNLITLNKLKLSSGVVILPAFLIFAVLLEVMTIRTHFFASQLLCFLIIESFKSTNHRLDNKVFLIFLCLFISSRLENIVIYFPILLLLLKQYFYYDVLLNDSKSLVQLFFATISPLIINYHGYSASLDVRSNLFLLTFLVVLLNIFTIFNKKSFIKFIHKKFNFIFVISLLFLAIALYYLFSSKALISWLFIFNHLMDTHQGWAVVVFYFVIVLIYLTNRTHNDELKKTYITFFLTFILIIISSPLHHSVYGGEEWSSGVIEGLAIYNPFDESQTRSFLQLFLTILPLSCLLTSQKREI